MSVEFENKIKKVFSELDIGNFRVDMSKQHLFVCGGAIDVTATVPPSFRDRVYTYTSLNELAIHDAFILAETFKDYFKENTYTDLLVFEDEIANLSTLVIIFLESPGALVELGMFCNKPSFYNKLLVICPHDKVAGEDSFIYLGPLENIRKKDETSVVIYPWPDPSVADYDHENLIDLCDLIKSKLSASDKTKRFDADNTGHIAYLICEIINLCYPILIGEIELVLKVLGLNSNKIQISRNLYLLIKFRLIDYHSYSTNKYYFPLNDQDKKIKFGLSTNKQSVDRNSIQVRIRQSFVMSDDPLSRKRRSALKLILAKLSGGGV